VLAKEDRKLSSPTPSETFLLRISYQFYLQNSIIFINTSVIYESRKNIHINQQFIIKISTCFETRSCDQQALTQTHDSRMWPKLLGGLIRIANCSIL